MAYPAIQFDAQGRPFTVGPNGQPSYISPSQAAQYAHMFVPDPDQRAAVNAGIPPDVLARLEAYARQHRVTLADPNGDTPTNTFAHQNNGWNDKTGAYNMGMNWGGLGGAILGGAGLAGPLAIGPALAGAGGGTAASGLAADGTIPFTTAPGASAAAASGAVGPAAGLGASAPLGSLSVAGGAAGGAGAAGAAGAPAAKGFLDNLKSPGNIASLAGIIASLVGGGGGNTSGTDETKRIQAITEARMRRVDPLHQMVTQLAASRMPINVQRPVPDVPLP